jgi:manganese/zinc/iron transport system permease protein
MLEILQDLFFDYTLRTVALGSATLGIVSGILGAFAVLRKQSLLGDAISHAALPGIALAFLLTGSKAPLVLILGAAIAGWIATLLIMAIVNTTRIKYDTALGMLLSVFFGLGLVLLTFIQKIPTAAQAGLDKFLFGQASALLVQDVYTMAALGIIVLIVLVFLWKEFKLLCFDPDFMSSIGYPSRLLDILLTTLLVIAIVIGLQTVGVVLMSAMIVAPGSAARQWTDKLSLMILLSALFGALAGVSGAVISSTITKMPTGPTIVLCISSIVLFSLIFAPHRGLFWKWAFRKLSRRRLQLEVILSDLYELALQHNDKYYPHTETALAAMGADRTSLAKNLTELERNGTIVKSDGNRWALTDRGIAEIENILGKRDDD